MKFNKAYWQAVLLVLIALFFTDAQAQQFVRANIGDPQPIYRNINASNGLPSSETYDILQDREGFIWIATDRGVVRYDGFHFRTYTTKDGLPDDVIFRFYQDPKGRIWFISYNGLLSYREKGRIVPYRYNGTIRKFIGNKMVAYKNLAVDRNDNVYYSLQSLGGICISRTGKMRLLNGSINKIYISRRADQWFPIQRKLKNKRDFYVHVFSKGKEFKQWHYPTGPSLLDISGNFLLINNDIYNLKTLKKMITGKNLISLDTIGSDLFVGHYLGGVRQENLRLPEGHKQRSRYLLRGHSVSSVMRDSEGGYWFTTLDNGVYYTPSIQLCNYTKDQGLANMEYSAITGIGGSVYVADALGCTKFQPVCMYMRLDMARKNPAIGHSAGKLHLNWDRSHWAMSKTVSFLICSTTSVFSTRKNYVLSVCSLLTRVYDNGRVDTLYWASYAGNKQAPFFAYVVETPKGRLFGGGIHGIYEVRNKRALNDRFKDTLFRQRVTAMENHPILGTVVGTRSDGVYCFDEHYRITRRITLKDGLPSNLIRCLYTDDQGCLYIGTSRGLMIFEPLSGGKFRHRNLGTSQGLCSGEINGVYRYGNSLWIATKKGVAVCDLRAVKTYPRGGIGLAWLSVDGRSGQLAQKELSLPAGVQLVKVAMRTTNFSGFGQHRFKYRLRPDGKWFETNDPEIALNEPRWGDYDITVKFRNDTGAWSRPVSLIRFSVEAPFYAKWYFLLLLSAGFAAIVFWIFRIVLRRVQQRHVYQTTINDLTQRALRAQMNPHFIFNSLNSIQSFLVFEENEKAEKYLLKFAQLIRQTLNNSRESYITIESEMDTLRRYLELEQMRFKDKFTFRITGNLSREELLCGVPPMLIQPFVENAVLHGFRHIESGGLVQVTFELRKDRQLLCTVEDNGAGRNATARDVSPAGHQSFGTKITEERLSAFRQKYGNDFAIEITDKQENGKAAGTKVVIRIPVVPSHEFNAAHEV